MSLLHRPMPLTLPFRALDVLLRGARQPINSEFAIARHFSNVSRAHPIPRLPRNAPARIPRRRIHTTKRLSDQPHTPPSGSFPPQPQTISQKLKALSREYGYSAVGVYLALSALDFPFCYLAVRWLGTDRIGRWEHKILGGFWWMVGMVAPGMAERRAERVTVGADGVGGDGDGMEGGMDMEKEIGGRKTEGGEHGSGEGTATIWTQLALAYAIHKSLIFIRVPLTAAVLPKVVKTLRSWGYNIGKKRPKPSH